VAVRLVRVLVLVLMRMARSVVMLLVHVIMLVNVHVIVPSLVHMVAAVVGMGVIMSSVVREVIHCFGRSF
jgi:ribosomal protein S5